MLDSLIMYLKANVNFSEGESLQNVFITEADRSYIISTNQELFPKIVEQLDRDDDHPVVMNQVKVFSRVLSIEGLSLTVEIEPCN